MIGLISGALIIGIAGTIVKKHVDTKNERNQENIRKAQNYAKSQMIENVKSDYQKQKASLKEEISSQAVSTSESPSVSESLNSQMQALTSHDGMELSASWEVSQEAENTGLLSISESKSVSESISDQAQELPSMLDVESNASSEASQNADSVSVEASDSMVVSQAIEKASQLASTESLITATSISIDESTSASVKDVLSDNLLEIEKAVINQDDIDISYQEVDLHEDSIESICTKLGEKLDDHKLIGYDLLQLLGNKDARDYLYRYTRNSLLMNYARTGNYIGDQRKIIITLILIAYEYYDGSYWDHVADVFDSVYKKRNTEKLNGILRSVINHYAVSEARQINYVIRQTITPKHYLSDFIEFVFDIYKNDFQYELMDENLNEYLKNILFSLSDMDANNGRVNGASNKKYTLIKTTKSIIDNPEWFGELIMYTRLILTYIDQVYWQNNYEGLPYREFFEPIFREWVTDHNTLFFKDRVHGEKKKTSWSPALQLKGTDIILTIPNHILSQQIDPRSVNIVVKNGDTVLETIERPFIEEITAGYLMHHMDITIANPLGHLNYVIYSGHQEVYTSQNRLGRNYLIFDDQGKELKPSHQYEGQIDICVNKGACLDGKTYYDGEFYELRTHVIAPYDTLTINQQIVSFSKVKDYQIDGTLCDDLQIRVQNTYYPVYRIINTMHFLLEGNYEWGLRINEQRYRSFDLKDIQVTPFTQGSMISIPASGLLRQGFNYVEVFAYHTGKKIHSLFLFIDERYHSSAVEKDGHIHLTLKSVMTDRKEYDLDLTKERYNEIAFESAYFSYSLYLVVKLNIALYRLDSSSWQILRHAIWKDDFNNYSRLWLDGFSFDHVLILDDHGRQIQMLAKNTLQGKAFIQMSSLVMPQNEQKFVSVVFIDKDIAVGSLKIYYQNILLDNSFKAACDEDTGQITISFQYEGKDVMHVKLQDHEEIYYQTDVSSSPVQLNIDHVETFKNMDLVITAGTDNLFSLDAEEYEVDRRAVSFYSFRDIVGKTFTVPGMWGERYNSKTKTWDDRRHSLRHTYLIIDQRIDDSQFKGRVAYLYEHEAISENVDIMITSEIDKGGFWCSLYVDDDLLLYDMKKKTILFDESSPEAIKAMPISECKCKY